MDWFGSIRKIVAYFILFFGYKKMLCKVVNGRKLIGCLIRLNKAPILTKCISKV